MKTLSSSKKKQGGWAAAATVAAALIQSYAAKQAAKKGSSSNSSGTSQTNSTKTSNTLNLTMEDQNLLRALSGQATANVNQFSKQNAITDTEDLLQGAMRGLREQAIPDILKGQINSGSYNNVTSALLANDAAARTAEAVARQRLDTINQYGQLQIGNTQIAGQIVEALKGANVQTISNENTNVVETGSQVGKNAQGGQNAALAAALVGKIGEIYGKDNKAGTPDVNSDTKATSGNGTIDLNSGAGASVSGNLGTFDNTGTAKIGG